MKLLIKEQIKASGLKQSYIATRLNVTNNTVSRWVRGETVPSFRQAIELSKVLGIDLNELWEDDD